MNVGIIGTGAIAKKLAKAINCVDGANLSAVSSRTLDRARHFAEEFNVSLWYEGLNDFLNNTDIDLVYIATPNNFHYQNTIDALNSGKSVLCEKPFALNYIESKKMIEIAEKKNLLLVEAMWTKYFPGIKRVKNILDSGILGDIVTVHGDLSYLLDGKDRLFDRRMGGGALLDLGIYPITVMHHFMGNPENILASSQFTETGVDESTSMIFSYKSGAKALISCSINAKSTNEFSIFCSKGWIRLNDNFTRPTSISYFSQKSGERHEQFLYENLGYEYQIEGVLADFNGNKTESSTVKQSDTLEIMKILDIVRNKVGLSFE